MIAVSNTSPLITLSRAGYVDALAQLFEKVYLPEAVHREIFEKEDETSRKISELIKRSFVQIKRVKNSDMVMFLNIELGAGESEAIALSREIIADYILLDDLKARVYARSLEINVIGTLGLIRALLKKKAIEEELEEIYKKLKSVNFWITRELFLDVIKNAEPHGKI